VRIALCLVVAVLVGVFVTAGVLQVIDVNIKVLGLHIKLGHPDIGIKPYDEEGHAYTMETHRQLGLPECTFKTLTGKPCPSCGLTTSFALLVHGDVINSLRANSVGTLLAVFLVLVIPWAVVSVVRGRTLFIRSIERALTWTVACFLALLLLRWVIVVCYSS
jgi:hypothetical protein